jgi:undecaprenyl-diphosphatase
LPTWCDPRSLGIVGQVLVGSLAAGIAAYVSPRFPTPYFETCSLTAPAIYGTIAGGNALVWTPLARQWPRQALQFRS